MIDNMILIFAVDNNWNIGYDGEVPVPVDSVNKLFNILK